MIPQAELPSDEYHRTLVQVMAWCRQATSHYMNQCWPRSLPPYGITRPHWVKTSLWSQRDRLFPVVYVVLKYRVTSYWLLCTAIHVAWKRTVIFEIWGVLGVCSKSYQCSFCHCQLCAILLWTLLYRWSAVMKFSLWHAWWMKYNKSNVLNLF